MSSIATTFTHALTRVPARSATAGLRAVDVGAPDIELFREHHRHYVAALREAGAEVIVLDALEDYPDSAFVEDVALCLPGIAVLLRPGAPSRRGEVAAMRPALEALYGAGAVHALDGPGCVEGGDILLTDEEVLVGLSARTDVAGVAELTARLAPAGHTVRTVETPPEVLHFKTDCSLLDGRTVLATRRLADGGCFDGYDVVRVADGEEACANAVRFNDVVLFPAGFPGTAAALREAGYDVREIANTEAAKIDGGMSCLSLRFSP